MYLHILTRHREVLQTGGHGRFFVISAAQTDIEESAVRTPALKELLRTVHLDVTANKRDDR